MILQKTIAHNREFVANKSYKEFITSKYPSDKVAIITCMDSRLVELLPAALGHKNGDVMIIKNAGGIISHPFGSVIRSLIVAIYQLGVESVWVIGHTDCGMERLIVGDLLDKMKARGVDAETIERVAHDGIDYESWLGGFDNVENAILDTMRKIERHPLIPNDISIEGMIIDTVTGELTQLASFNSSK